MGILDGALGHVCTYWAGTPNATGGTTWGPPHVLPCRWERKQKLIRGKSGQELVSRARVFLAVDIGIDNRMALGAHQDVADPTTLDSCEAEAIEDLTGFDGSEGCVVWLR